MCESIIWTFLYSDGKDTTPGSSSVALWIKSLKESNVAFDDSSQDYHAYTGN